MRWLLAEERRDGCWNDGDVEEGQYWQEVCDYLEAVEQGRAIEIVESV